MICPKCKCEYEEGYLSCSDCGVMLIPAPICTKKDQTVSATGLSLINLGIALIFFIVFEIITVIIAYEFLWIYKSKNSGVLGTAFENIPSLFWVVFIIEFLVSLHIIVKGFGKKETN